MPSSRTASKPSVIVPRPSGCAWRCKRKPPTDENRASFRTNDVQSSVPQTAPDPGYDDGSHGSRRKHPTPRANGRRAHESEPAAQVKKPLRSRKCSSACTTSARSSVRAVPIALVPRYCSCHVAPGRSATRSALSTNRGSPEACKSMPSALASTTMLSVSRVWSKRTHHGRACATNSR